MICPLLAAGYKTVMISSHDPGAACLKEQCAWWVDRHPENKPHFSGCAVTAIAREKLDK